VGKWLSKAAVLWVLDEAPGLPPRLVAALIAVAAYTDEHGHGARAAASEIARRTRKSERQAQRDLAELEKIGLLRRGDQTLAAHIPPNFRPNVYDIPLDTSPTSYQGRKFDTTPRANRYDTGDASVRHPRRTTISRKEMEEQRAPRARAQGASAGAPGTYLAPPCPDCGKPFSQEQLADPEFRAVALAGYSLHHPECTEAKQQQYIATASIAELVQNGYLSEAIDRNPAQVRAILAKLGEPMPTITVDCEEADHAGCHWSWCQCHCHPRGAA
jgi:hypothetical protein